MAAKPTATLVILSAVAWMVSTFAVQATSHFVINQSHYAGIPFIRPEPIMALGVLTMAIQGIVLGMLFGIVHRGTRPMRDALWFAWALAVFFGSYTAIAEPSKYAAPSVAAWIAVEAPAVLVQFTLFGLALGWIHRTWGRTVAREPTS